MANKNPKSEFERLFAEAQKSLSGLNPGVLSYDENKGGYGCAQCVFFNGDRKPCDVVETPVRKTGCCNFWEDDDSKKYDGPKLDASVAVYIDLSPSGKYVCGECEFYEADEDGDCDVVGHKVSAERGSCTAWTLPEYDDDEEEPDDDDKEYR